MLRTNNKANNDQSFQKLNKSRKNKNANKQKSLNGNF